LEKSISIDFTKPRKTRLLKKIQSIEETSRHFDNMATALELIKEEGDDDLSKEFLDQYENIKQKINQWKQQVYLSHPYDMYGCTLRLVAGQGGLEAQQWTQFLHRMYLRYALRRGWKVEAVSEEYTEAGLREAEMIIEEEYAYGFLKLEHGVHRLQRVSPFDSAGKRQTSFCRVEVTPLLEVEDTPDIDWEKDVIDDPYCASGPGGQHRNKTLSAVRLTHIPTGITAQSAMKSQHQNRKIARDMLVARLAYHYEQERKKKEDNLKGPKIEASWGNHIRTYVMDDKRVKDHRINYEERNPDRVLNGELDNFIENLLMWNASKDGNGNKNG